MRKRDCSVDHLLVDHSQRFEVVLHAVADDDGVSVDELEQRLASLNNPSQHRKDAVLSPRRSDCYIYF